MQRYSGRMIENKICSLKAEGDRGFPSHALDGKCKGRHAWGDALNCVPSSLRIFPEELSVPWGLEHFWPPWSSLHLQFLGDDGEHNRCSFSNYLTHMLLVLTPYTLLGKSHQQAWLQLASRRQDYKVCTSSHIFESIPSFQLLRYITTGYQTQSVPNEWIHLLPLLST